MSENMVTVVVVPRDHFSDAVESLESIIANTDYPHSLVYVDGGSPRPVADEIKRLSSKHNFRIIRTEHYLTPNNARNMGAEGIDSRYVVFIDNDVVVAPGWLKPLVDCAESTGAGIANPLTFQDRPFSTIVHFAGGMSHIETKEVDGRTERHIVDKINNTSVPTENVTSECAEFHCLLIRTEAFRQVGGMDEEMLSTRENLDFCIDMRNHGHEIYIVPASKITYLPPVVMETSDVPYFALRWSDAFDMASFQRFRDKWDLTEDDYFAYQYKNLGWRRRGLMLQGKLLRRIPTWKLRLAVARVAWPIERRINRRLSARYAQQHLSAGARDRVTQYRAAS